MTSVRPYLVRAVIDWVVDNNQTPYVAIDCAAPGVDVPLDRTKDGKLVLNVSATATRNLDIGNETLNVDCRFGGRPVHIRAPVGAIVAVYARESGMGMAFETEVRDGESPASGADAARTGDASDGANDVPPKPRRGGPKLTLVK